MRSRWLLAALLCACRAELPGPHPELVEPAAAYRDEAQPITIRGRNFLAYGRADFAHDGVSVDATFRVRLGDRELLDVVRADARTLTALVPAGLPAGAHDLTIIAPDGATGTLSGAFAVNERPLLSIELVPGGAGVNISSYDLRLGNSVTLYAVARRFDGSFVADVEADWALDGGIGALAPLAGASSVLTATATGTGHVVITSPGYAAGLSGSVHVRQCLGDADCVDACHGAPRCTGGSCRPGAADRDVDRDGVVDALCGGGDCDDSNALCAADCTDNDGDGACPPLDCADLPGADPACGGFDGSACRPGGSELCDGANNDCDLATPDGTDDTRPEQSCDGPDMDLCRDDVYLACADGALLCSDGSDDVELCSTAGDEDCDGASDAADPDCGSVNTPPRAALVVTPAAGDSATVFSLAAGASSDVEDAAADLTFDWDWDRDALFDASGVTATHSYPEGEHGVTVRVADSGGLAAWAAASVVVAPTLLVITIGADVSDASDGELSLREAIDAANATPGPQTIVVPAGTVTVLLAALPGVLDDGLTFFADGAVLDGSSLPQGSDCLNIVADGGLYAGLEVADCPRSGVVISGTSNRVERFDVHDNTLGFEVSRAGNVLGPGNVIARNAGAGVQLYAATTVYANRIHDNGSYGIFLGAAAGGSTVHGNVVWRNAVGLFVGPQSHGHRIVHNTVHGQLGAGLLVQSSARDLELRNNAVTSNGDWGLNGADVSFAFNDHNAYDANTRGACSACGSLGTGSLEAAPQYVDAAAGDLRLLASSPLVDAGIDVAVDANGAAPGSFAGSAPDVGAEERL